MNALSGIRLNNLGPGLITSEIDNITDAFGFFDAGEKKDLFSNITDTKGKDGFFGAVGDFIRAATVGETFAAIDPNAKVDSIAGIAGSMVKSLVNPLDAITDLTSGVSILARSLQDGSFGVGTMFEAATYFGSAIPVLGAAVDVTKLTEVFKGAQKTVGNIGDLNKGFTLAFDAAKANSKGVKIAENLLTDDLSSIMKASYWDDIKNLTVKFKEGDAFKEMAMTDALKQVRKIGTDNASLRQAIENTQQNFNLRIGENLKDLNAKDLIRNQQDSHSWNTASSKLKDLEIRVGDRVLGNKKFNSIEQYSAESRFHQKKLKGAGQTLVDEGKKITEQAKPIVQGGMYQFGRFSNTVKENAIKPFKQGLSGLSVPA
jgi:hypothetical protein